MAFEAVGVAALLFAGLAVPAQALEAFGFHLVGEVFVGSYFGFGHGDGGAGRATLWFGWGRCEGMIGLDGDRLMLGRAFENF